MSSAPGASAHFAAVVAATARARAVGRAATPESGEPQLAISVLAVAVALALLPHTPLLLPLPPPLVVSAAAASHRCTAMLYCTIQDKVEVGACWRARPGSWRRAPYGRRGSARRTRPGTAARRPSAREGPAQTRARAVRCARNGGAARVGGRATAHRGVGQHGDRGGAGDCGRARTRARYRCAPRPRGHVLCKGHRSRCARTALVCESPAAASRSKAA